MGLLTCGFKAAGPRGAPDLTPCWHACNFLSASAERAGKTGTECGRSRTKLPPSVVEWVTAKR
ncbi:hypothetical protein Lesp02_82290 [Lentzea sp. NBRC 105346]|nr:hypothetical protein Lesp02_82290 [Lentzea sp. NBRC 105346]